MEKEARNKKQGSRHKAQGIRLKAQGSGKNLKRVTK
jgi:hypothetical protein